MNFLKNIYNLIISQIIYLFYIFQTKYHIIQKLFKLSTAPLLPSLVMLEAKSSPFSFFLFFIDHPSSSSFSRILRRPPFSFFFSFFLSSHILPS